MTSTPSDEPTVPGESTPPPPPPPPAPSGYEVPPVTGSVPPPAYGTTPPGGYAPPPPPGYGTGPGAGYPPPTYGAPGAGAPLSDAEQRQWATLAHAGGILLWLVAPLIVWLMYKERGRFVEEQAKEALNFQISVAIGAVVISILTVVTFGLASFLFPVLWLVMVVFAIIAAMATNKGEAYRYPINWRILK